MRWLVGLVVAVLVPWVSVAPAHAAPHRRVPCSRGLVALTFDDGPSTAVTPRLVRLLRREGVPATFFMIGEYAAAHPELVRLVARAGFTIGNHTWAHEDLTTRSNAQIRTSIRKTHQAIVDAGVQPSALARPPYGAVDARVRHVLATMGYQPVLWTIDPRDWAGASTPQIEARVLGAVRPHRANVVLQHDGVTNSPATLRAVPTEIATLRRRGYCFAALDAAGRPTPPVPVATAYAARARVAEGARVRVVVRLDRPTTRPTSVRLSADGRLSADTVRIGAGRTSAKVWLRVPQDEVDEHAERVTVRVVGGTGIQPGAPLVLRVVDDDPAPVVSVGGATVDASPLLPTSVTLPIGLDRVSDLDVTVVVSCQLGQGIGTIPAGTRTGQVVLAVPIGTPGQPEQDLPVTVARADHAVPGAAATLVVRPPTVERVIAGRLLMRSISWPAVAPVGLF